MKKAFILLPVLLVACSIEPTLDARNSETLWASFDVVAQKKPEIASTLEQAILDIRNHANAGPGDRKLEVTGLSWEVEGDPTRAELVFRSAIQGKTASEVIDLARALNHGEGEGGQKMLSPVYF